MGIGKSIVLKRQESEDSILGSYLKKGMRQTQLFYH
jgi:hypothetical protein